MWLLADEGWGTSFTSCEAAGAPGFRHHSYVPQPVPSPVLQHRLARAVSRGPRILQAGQGILAANRSRATAGGPQASTQRCSDFHQANYDTHWGPTEGRFGGTQKMNKGRKLFSLSRRKKKRITLRPLLPEIYPLQANRKCPLTGLKVPPHHWGKQDETPRQRGDLSPGHRGQESAGGEYPQRRGRCKPRAALPSSAV